MPCIGNCGGNRRQGNPAYLPENYSPSLPPYSWTVSYKVCAPQLEFQLARQVTGTGRTDEPS